MHFCILSSHVSRGKIKYLDFQNLVFNNTDMGHKVFCDEYQKDLKFQDGYFEILFRGIKSNWKDVSYCQECFKKKEGSLQPKS